MSCCQFIPIPGPSGLSITGPTGPTGPSSSGPIPVTNGDDLLFWSPDINIIQSTGGVGFSLKGSDIGTTIYNGDSTLTDNRIVNQANQSLLFDNAAKFEVNHFFGVTGATGATFLVDDNFLGFGSPGLAMAKLSNGINTLHIMGIIEPSIGNVQSMMGYFNSTTNTHARIIVDAARINIGSDYSTAGGSNETIIVNGNTPNPYNTNGQIEIQSDAIILKNIPQTGADRLNQVLVRNIVHGAIELQTIPIGFIQCIWTSTMVPTTQTVINSNPVFFNHVTTSDGSSIILLGSTINLIPAKTNFRVSWRITSTHDFTQTPSTYTVMGCLELNGSLLNSTAEYSVAAPSGPSSNDPYVSVLRGDYIITTDDVGNNLLRLCNIGVLPWNLYEDNTGLLAGAELYIIEM